MNAEDTDFVRTIMEFNPQGQRPDFYGKDVAKKMVTEIEKFCSLLY